MASLATPKLDICLTQHEIVNASQSYQFFKIRTWLVGALPLNGVFALVAALLLLLILLQEQNCLFSHCNSNTARIEKKGTAESK